MDAIDIAKLFVKHFPHQPTLVQKKAIYELAKFIVDDSNETAFVLRGYAGTGKTTLVSVLVKILPILKMRSVLLAPTGRAAKVLSSYSKKKAFTIHKKIYFIHADTDGSTLMRLAENKHKNTFFLVDEASMIPDRSKGDKGGMFTDRNILDDLVHYVEGGDNCRLILIGDTAQLPPVHLDISPALNLQFLQSSYSFKLYTHELNEVVRQKEESGVLYNATNLRLKVSQQKQTVPLFDTRPFNDIERISGIDLEEILHTMFSSSGWEESVVITRSNKRANIFNQEIRNRILFHENEITSGDYLMVVKNNYYWLPKESTAGFIANGDIIEILRINGFKELYGFRFADVQVRLIDYPEEKDFDCKIMLDTLMLEGPSLGFEDHRRLYLTVMEDYMDIKNKRGRTEAVRNNPFFNALQVKFSYALTCHKTQGGQWENVIIDAGYINEEQIDVEYLRWMYTAVTRATQKLYLLNFPELFYKQYTND